MSEVFADTGYWVALLRRRDHLHDMAVAESRRLATQTIVTTHMVMVEVLNYMSGEGTWGRSRAWQLWSSINSDSRFVLIPQTATQLDAATAMYARASDQTWSLTDCASFIVMEERGITEALAHDRDFEQAGFIALLRNDQG